MMCRHCGVERKVLFDHMLITQYQSLERSEAFNLTITEPFAGNALQT